MRITKENVADVFACYVLSPGQVERMNQVRDALQKAAEVVLENCPETSVRTRALNAITDARMLANQSIALEHQG